MGLSLREIVAHNIKGYRVQRKLTQKKLAAATNLTPEYISAIECSSKNLTLDNLEQIAHALEVDVTELIVLEKLKIPISKDSAAKFARTVQEIDKAQDSFVKICGNLKTALDAIGIKNV